MSKPHIITISGPSLSGKTELSNLLKNELNYNSVVSVTTRPQRSQEKNGVDYYFITKDEYSYLEKTNKLVQKTQSGEFAYGVTEDEVIKNQDKPILWVIMPKSINQIEEMCANRDYDLTKVFINNSDEILFSRLFERFKEDKLATVETYVKRLTEMISSEREWINQASFDLVVNNFTKETQNKVIEEIAKEIENKLNLKNKGLKM